MSNLHSFSNTITLHEVNNLFYPAIIKFDIQIYE